MLTGLFLILFFLLFTRLWFIQVAAGKTYQTQASRQTVYQVSTQAPRGEIRDREGRLLATSRFVPAILVDRKQLPTDLVEDVQQQLSTMLDIPPGEIADAFETGGPRITIAEVDAETAYRVMERRRQLPGVVVELVPARVYPEGDVLAHVLGHIGTAQRGGRRRAPRHRSQRDHRQGGGGADLRRVPPGRPGDGLIPDQRPKPGDPRAPRDPTHTGRHHLPHHRPRGTA